MRFNPNPPPKDPVRMSRRLIDTIIQHRHTTGFKYYQIAGRAGVDKSLLSSLMHGKVVNQGDPRLAKIGQYFGLAPEEWEEPA
jgi:transcriptional regulator with XRE-family HTH domain